MDFTLREWLLVIGAVLIIGVLIDGYRRARIRKRGTLKLAIDKNLKFRDEDRVDYYHGELPSGSARVVRRSTDDTELGDPEVTAEDGVPAASTVADNEFFPGDRDLRPDPLFADEPLAADVEAALGERLEDPQEQAAPDSDTPIEQEPAVAAETERQADDVGAATRDVEEVIVINAFAREEPGFKGDELMGVILACGMRFGDMDIFHRSEQDDGKGATQFSMANAVKPGSFDLDAMKQFATPGVSFFMSLPGPDEPMLAFDYMLETAQCLVKNLGGDLRDEQHSTLTGQTIEHARQKIRDFERRQLSLLQ